VFSTDEKLKDIVRVKMEESTMELLKKANNLYNDLTKIWGELDKFAQLIQDVKHKAFVDQGFNFVMEQPIFKTWALHQYYEHTLEVLSVYKTELEVKHAILSDIAITASRDTAMVYLATWQMQPYISQKLPSKQLLLAEMEET